MGSSSIRMLVEREAEEASPSPAGTPNNGQVGASGEDRPGRAVEPGRVEGWLLPQGGTATPSAAPPGLIDTRIDGHDHLITCSAGEPRACVSICCRSPCCGSQPLSFPLPGSLRARLPPLPCLPWSVICFWVLAPVFGSLSVSLCLCPMSLGLPLLLSPPPPPP